VILPVDEVPRGDRAGAALQAGTWFVIGIPMCTAVWAYVVLPDRRPCPISVAMAALAGRSAMRHSLERSLSAQSGRQKTKARRMQLPATFNL
jgi:hypothetical protein